MKILVYLFLIISLPASAENWIQKANFGGTGRHRATGISIGNKGYIGLGHVNGTGVDISYKDWWQYDPASNSWTQKANYPVNNHGAVAFGTDTRGYVGGGSALSSEFYEYNPQSNSWSPIAPCPFSPGDVQVFSVQNKGYVYFGTQFAEYNPSTNVWTLKASVPVNVNTWSSAFANESSGFVKSGYSMYEYKPAQDIWIARTSFPGIMAGGAAAFEKEGKGYFVCGYYSGLSNVTNEVWEFNPGNNIWTMVGEFPGTSRRFPVAFSINDKGYFGTGTNGINMNDFWQFDFYYLNTNELDKMDFSCSTFPNPSTDKIDIQLLNASIQPDEVALQIYSSTGALICEKTFEASSIEITKEQIGTGLFYYQLIHNSSPVHSGKIIFN